VDEKRKKIGGEGRRGEEAREARREELEMNGRRRGYFSPCTALRGSGG
jgi:hypothetical protein